MDLHRQLPPLRFPRLQLFRLRFQHLGLTSLALLGLMVVFTTSLSAQTSTAHPTLAGVLDMLEADISDPVIIRWLHTAEPLNRALSATEMVALRKAGAGDPLLNALLDFAAEPPRAASEPSSGAGSPSSASATQATTPASNSVSEPVARPSGSSAADRSPSSGTPVDGHAEVTFTLSYSPYFLEDEEEWQLYLYLNSEPLTYVPSSGLTGKTLSFTRSLPAGDHELRLTRELHEPAKKGSTKHRARVADVKIPLSLQASNPVDVEVKFRQTLLKSYDPISYRISQGGKTDLREQVGGNPDRWQEVCEDIQLSLGDDSKIGRSTKRRLNQCAEWKSLWTGSTVIDRAQVLKGLALFDYRPIPREQDLH